MIVDDQAASLRRENEALRKTIAALSKRVDGMLGQSSSSYDTFTQSVLLQQIVGRRTKELEAITESVRTEAARRRKAEESMRRERRLLKSVLTHIPHLVSWKDTALLFSGCNAAFARTVGLASSDDIVGVTEDDLPRGRADVTTHLSRECEVIATGEAIIDAEDSFEIPGAPKATFLTSIVPMRNDEGDIAGVLTISADITERKSLETQLAQAQKLESIGQLAAGIAHEINTPAQYVGDNTKFVSEEFDGLLQIIDKIDGICTTCPKRSEEIRQALEALDYAFLREEIPKALEQSIEGIGRITHIVRAMKEFSHPGATSKESADLNKAIESTVTVCSNRWKYAADLDLELDPNLPPVSCLLGDLNQVILNLLVNAADAIESTRQDERTKGKIVVRSGVEGDYAVIEISDTGGGIPADIREKIFDPFFTTKGVGKGTGQGLAISRNVIVHKHGGTLDCDVEPGQGTTFTIRLPIDTQ